MEKIRLSQFRRLPALDLVRKLLASRHPRGTRHKIEEYKKVLEELRPTLTREWIETLEAALQTDKDREREMRRLNAARNKREEEEYFRQEFDKLKVSDRVVYKRTLKDEPEYGELVEKSRESYKLRPMVMHKKKARLVFREDSDVVETIDRPYFLVCYD